MILKNEYNRIYKDLVNKIYNQELNHKNIFLENNEKIPSFSFNEQTNQLRICFQTNQLDNKQSLNDFYNSLQDFKCLSKEISTIIMKVKEDFKETILNKYVDIISIEHQPRIKKLTTHYDRINLKAFDDIMNYAIAHQLSLMINGKEVKIFKKDIEIQYTLRKDNDSYLLSHNLKIENVQDMIYTKTNLYMMYHNDIYQCSEKFMQKEFILILELILNLKTEFSLNKEELTSFLYLMMPNMIDKMNIEATLKEEIEQLKPKKLEALLYLDFNQEGDIVATLKFQYEKNIFNPIEQEISNINRNILQEAKILQKLQKTGFLLNTKNKSFIMNNNNLIYQFISEGIEEYIKEFKVFSTDNFNRNKIKSSSQITLGVKIENNLLNINFENIDIKKEELKDILQKYRLKKKYHRLKDGTFLKLEDNKEIEFLDNILTGMDISYKELEGKVISLPINRTLYLDKLLNANKNINIHTDEKYEKIVNDINLFNTTNFERGPSNLKAKLRDYQLIGYQWLKVLDSYHLGGILADDMGLRKNNTNFICYIRIYSESSET